MVRGRKALAWLAGGAVVLAVLAVPGWYAWSHRPQPPLSPLPPSATPERMTRRYFEELERNRLDDARALIAPEMLAPGREMALDTPTPFAWLSSDPAYWKGVRLDPASHTVDQEDLGRLYAPYRDFVVIEAHLNQVYRDGQSNDYQAGDPVDLYFYLGRKNVSSPWRIVAIEDNGV